MKCCYSWLSMAIMLQLLLVISSAYWPCQEQIHFGKFLLEVKLRESPYLFQPHIQSKDTAALLKLIMFENVEESWHQFLEMDRYVISGHQKDGDLLKFNKNVEEPHNRRMCTFPLLLSACSKAKHLFNCKSTCSNLKC
jgi:hypothetical protein